MSKQSLISLSYVLNRFHMSSQWLHVSLQPLQPSSEPVIYPFYTFKSPYVSSYCCYMPSKQCQPLRPKSPYIHPKPFFKYLFEFSLMYSEPILIPILHYLLYIVRLFFICLPYRARDISLYYRFFNSSQPVSICNEALRTYRTKELREGL